jgi:hypothetical protein
MHNYLSIIVLGRMKLPRICCIALHKEKLASGALAITECVGAYNQGTIW